MRYMGNVLKKNAFWTGIRQVKSMECLQWAARLSMSSAFRAVFDERSPSLYNLT